MSACTFLKTEDIISESITTKTFLDMATAALWPAVVTVFMPSVDMHFIQILMKEITDEVILVVSDVSK